MTGIDSILRVGLGQDLLTAIRQKGLAHAYRSHGLRAVPGPNPTAYVRAVRRPVPRGTSRTLLLLLRPVPLHGLRPTDVSRESPRHRDVPARPAAEVVPRRPARAGRAQHPGRRERDARLAGLRGFRPDLDPSCALAVPRRTLRGRGCPGG